MTLATEYDQWHRNVFESDPEHLDESSPWYRIVQEFLPRVEGKRILEIACGRGGFTRHLASQGAQVCGADFSQGALDIARARLRDDSSLEDRISYVQADAQNMPFEGNSFDIVVSCETIEHVPDPRAAVREMYRVAKPAGLLFLTTPNYLNFMGLHVLYRKLTGRELQLNQPLDERYLFIQIRHFIAGAGWTILRTDGTEYLFPFIPRRNPVRMAVLESNHAIRRILSPFAFHYFVIARKESPA